MSATNGKAAPRDGAELDLLGRVERAEAPRAAALAGLLRRPEAERLRCELIASLRGRWGQPTDPAPWLAASFGLVDPRHCAPRAYSLARRFLARLRRRPARRRRGIVRKARQEAANPALLDLFVEEAREVQSTDPEAALGWLGLVPLVSAALGAVGFPRAPLEAALVRAEAYRANALRLAGELPAAERVFRSLESDCRREALADPRAHAELASLEASLRIDLRQFQQAERLLARAEALCRGVRDELGAARALLQRGSAAEYAGDGERAVDLHRRAAALLDPEVDPLLHLMSQKNLADTLASLGQVEAAEEVLAAVRNVLKRVDDPVERVRFHWVEAHIARADNRLDDAERLLDDVRDGWFSLGRHYEAALAILESTELHLARGDWREVKHVAELLAPVFGTRGVHREAQAALILFQQAARAERLTEEFLAGLRRYLVLGRNDRSFRFDPAAV